MRKGLVGISVLLAVGVGIYLSLRRVSEPAKGSPDTMQAFETTATATVHALPAASTPPIVAATLPAAIPGPVTRAGSSAGAAVASPVAIPPLPAELADVTPLAAMENMRTALRLYGQTFHGNPVGTNPEITRTLGGENPRGINFLKEDGNRINSNGELVDIWGTPYFFHQLSGSETEIRSAGPDKIMWNLDDLVIK